MKPRVAITGAGGFLGTALAQRLLAAGAEVRAFSRTDPRLPGAAWHAYDLAGPVPPALGECDVIIHAAFAMGRSGAAPEALNIDAAARVLAAARANGRHFIFISSMSAHDGAASSYGRAKRAIERLLDPARDTIVRPGLVVGPGGVYARMLESLRRAPLVPLFFGGTQPVQLVGRDDLVAALLRLVELRLPGEFNLGTPDALSIRDLYRRLLQAAGRQRPIVPLPGWLALAVLRGTEAVGLRLPLTRENLLGQKHLRTFETTASYARLGLIPPSPDQLPWLTPRPPS